MNTNLEIIPDGRSLFLGDLSVYTTEKDVKDLFLPFGPIEIIKLKRGNQDRNYLSYGFVKFMHQESAQLAMEKLNGICFNGRYLKLGWAQPNVGKRFQPKDPLQNLKTAQIHVSFISKQVDALVSEATLRSLFIQYGPVIDVTIKKSQFDPKLRIQNGYGFIHYPMTQEGIIAAIHATRGIHQITVDRVTYDCSLSHALQTLIQNDKFLASHLNAPPVHPLSSTHSSNGGVIIEGNVGGYRTQPPPVPSMQPQNFPVQHQQQQSQMSTAKIFQRTYSNNSMGTTNSNSSSSPSHSYHQSFTPTNLSAQNSPSIQVRPKQMLSRVNSFPVEYTGSVPSRHSSFHSLSGDFETSKVFSSKRSSVSSDLHTNSESLSEIDSYDFATGLQSTAPLTFRTYENSLFVQPGSFDLGEQETTAASSTAFSQAGFTFDLTADMKSYY